ncbi:MAG: hypothetical protein K6G18_12985 [Treponema sp.]|nr:hypothetical protein [Treponema sp.]
MKVAVGASSFADGSSLPMKELADRGMEVIKNPFGRRLTEDETIAHLQGADGLLAGLEPLNERVFAASPQLKAVARIGIGMDNVDLQAAERHGIKVSNTPDGPTEAVAEMTLAMLLTLIHQAKPSDADIHAGIWKKRMGKSIRGLRVLVVGYGHIGRKVADQLKALGADVRVHDKYLPGASDTTLEDGLCWAEAVTLHVSGRDEVIGERELGLMAPGCYLLNSARGAVVNEDALYGALKDGRLAGFWGDALWQEPYGGKICGCGNTILTPHICTYTETCRASMEMEAARNLLRDLGI